MNRSLPVLPVTLLVVLMTASGVSGRQATGEPAPPLPTAALQQMLSQAWNTARTDVRQAVDILDRARATADQANDAAGVAHAIRLRAVLLRGLNRPDEAVEAWRTAELVWRKLGEGPLQIEALCWQAILVRDPVAAVTGLERAIALAQAETRRPRAALTQLTEVGIELLDLRRFDEAQLIYKAAFPMAERLAPGSAEQARVFNGLGSIAMARAQWRTAKEHHERALAIREALDPNSIGVAASLNNLGGIALANEDLATARARYERARSIREKVEPASLGLATSLYGLGRVAKGQGALDEARDYFARSLELRQELAPRSLEFADSLSGLAAVAQDRGDLTAARAGFQQALQITETSPQSPEHGRTLSNLGQVADLQGDLAGARAYYARALPILERQDGGSREFAKTLELLGILAHQQGDFPGARGYYTRTLEIIEHTSPDSLTAAQTYVHLGMLTSDEGDLERAKAWYQRALAITDRDAPTSPGVAVALANLGHLAERQGDLRSARDYYSRALERREANAPGSLEVAASLHSLGTLSRLEGDLGAALSYHQRALAIREKAAPGTFDYAQSLYELAALSNAQAAVAAAAEQTARAWTIVRGQGAIVAGDEARQAFEARYQFIGAQLVQLLLTLGKPDEAFAVLEQGRAQALLQALGARAIARRLAPAELWQRYEVSQAASNRAGKALEAALLSETRATRSGEREAAQRKTEDSRNQFERTRLEAEQRWADVARAIRPALPEPVGLEAARQALPADATMAVFTVGRESSTLFLIERGKPIRGYPIAASREQLAARIRLVPRATSRADSARGLAADGPRLRIEAARNLFAQLFPGESRALVLRAKRLVISPEGPLWDLPFAALVTNREGTPQYLGLQKPLTYTQSLTTFAQTMARASQSGSNPDFLIVGNPLYDNALRSTPTTSPAPVTRTARGEAAALSDDGSIPPPLPYAEMEATRVATLYKAQPSIGVQPTETWFRERAGRARVIHLATHGFFNPLRALSSGVHLAVPPTAPLAGETDNDGALQAWEVFTQLQLNADLVVLSACESGVGSRTSAEGLVGLTRAFQVAGAATVVASQWKVQDQSAAQIMIAFHQNLLKGLSRDAALHAAMRQVAGNKATADPYFWAPFILVGDPRPMPARAR